MKKFKKPSFMVVESSEDNSYCQINVEPLERGFANTLGNALRRTLISSTPGSSMISVKFEKANNEYVALKGVVEDVLSIILNLKKMAIKSDLSQVNETEISGFILENKSKIGKLYAKDIELPAGYSITNPDLYICTTSAANALAVTIYVTTGRGYYTFDETKNWLKESGCIPTDADFSPIRNVNYEVTSVTRDRERNDESLILRVTTDKTITAKEAVSAASKILQSHLEEFVNWSEFLPVENIILEKEEEEKRAVLDTQIEDLNLTVRSYNCLKRAWIESVKELTDRTEEEMMNLKNLGKKSYNEIADKVKELDLRFKEY